MLAVEKLYPCTGNRGIRFCEDKHPSGMLPASEFTPASLKSGTCKTCRKAMNDVRTHLYAYAGTSASEYYKLPRRVTDKIYNVIWHGMYSDGGAKVTVSGKEKLSKGMSLALAISGAPTVEEFYNLSELKMENALNVAESMMANGKTEVTARQTSEKRGFVYIITSPAYPGYVKIGKALDVLSRLNSYQTYSPLRDYKLEAYEFFADRKKAEDLTKRLLNSEQGVAGGEWYEVPVERAKRALANVKGIHVWPM